MQPLSALGLRLPRSPLRAPSLSRNPSKTLFQTCGVARCVRTGCATEQEPRLRPVRVRGAPRNVRYSVTNAPKSSAARSMARSLVGHQSCAHSHHVNKPIQSATNPAETDSMVIMESVSEDDVETCLERSKIFPRKFVPPEDRPACVSPSLPLNKFV